MTTDTALSPEQFDSPRAYATALAAALRADERFEPFMGYIPASLEESHVRLAELQRLLFETGWSRIGWPEMVGGLGGDPTSRSALFDTLSLLDIPVPESFTTLEILVPALLVYAPHLAVAHIASYLRGEESWAQGFSEPDAGSDLASLRTRLEPDGDGYRVTGQKIWASYGHMAERGLIMVRSGGPGHRGLSMVMVDFDQPGVELRAIRTQADNTHVSEMFFDGAYLPADHIIGELGGGWGVAMYMLQWERGAWPWLQQGRFHNRLRHMLALTEDRPAPPAHQAASLGHAYTLTAALRAHTRRTVQRLASEEALGPEASIDKLLLVDAEVAVYDSIRQVLGQRFHLDEDLAWLRTDFHMSRAAGIYGGSQEIQRNLVAQRVLGMPRES
jgi:alkylation response protein AidB-like acyl-CoA dehydrogenase